MVKSPALRIALGVGGVSVWNAELFGRGEGSRLRAFLASAFAVSEVEGVELRRDAAFARIHYAGALDPAPIWRKLGRAFRPSQPASSASEHGAPVDAGVAYLDRPDERPIHVARVGRVLCTWRVHGAGPNTLRLSHPILRNRRDVVFRLEEELSGLFGVQAYRASALTSRVSIRFGSETTAERIARGLEKAWPRLLEGLDGPPSRKRLFAAVGLTGLAYAGQYVVPALRPLGVAGVTLYSFPNVVNAVKLLRHGDVGLPTLYTTGLTFMLVSGLPFTAALMAALMQFWPQLARRKIVASQRRLFAGARRRPGWARRLRDGREDEIDAADLAKEELVLVRGGETIPVDGVVEAGHATVAPDAPFGGTRVARSAPGDTVAAGAVVLDGALTIRVERVGARTTASFVASLLPHAPLPGLPSSLEAERVANRNVKPTLALSALTLLANDTPVPAQAIIRPDYATGPRLSAQLSVLRGLADAFQRGILVKDPAALDRILGIDTIVLDAGAGIERRHLRVVRVEAVHGASPDLVVAYALAAYGRSRSERGLALSAFAARRDVAAIDASPIERMAGRARYRSRRGQVIEIAAPGALAARDIEAPKRFHTVLVRRSDASAGVLDKSPARDAPRSKLFVLSDGQTIGAISFARAGEMVGADLVSALAAQNPRVRIVYRSRNEDEQARQLATRLGIDVEDSSSGAELGNGGGSALWVGDGSDPSVGGALATSTVSVSVAPLARSPEDAADVLLTDRGLSGLLELLDLGRAHAARLAADTRAVYTANLLGVAGALVWDFGSLHTGLLSNVGTGVIYARHAVALGRMASAAERKRARFENLVRRWDHRA